MTDKEYKLACLENVYRKEAKKRGYDNEQTEEYVTEALKTWEEEKKTTQGIGIGFEVTS